jgi:tetratricopeptide (TPR) repeat protein
MKVIATVLSRGERPEIAGAVASVKDWADVVLLVDTDYPNKPNERTIREATNAFPGNVIITQIAWNGFGDARNKALAIANALANGSNSWAVTLDTDERLYCPLNVPGILRNSRADVLYLPSKDGTYKKERFFRLPAPLLWEGKTHEAYPAFLKHTGDMSGHFDELPKTPEQYLEKLTRDLEVLEQETKSEPNNARWWFYLGQTYEGLNDKIAAMHAYSICAEIQGWPEQAAFAAYRKARILMALENYSKALSAAVDGMKRQLLVELAWTAGLCCLHMGQYEQATIWANVIEAVKHDERLGFRALEANEGSRQIREAVALKR